ncbi:uncharacterized protein SCHCODRAFT_01100031 [Schizophyllum commune H4-8]|nr:uncharacterized protein SCHCODRAFT_01100031 [Schizophyllum commune H4-8]KAI5888963.1 hypothetical protein SCHCODRAFT_01100031 [Schizophyllum commune H4-8]
MQPSQTHGTLRLLRPHGALQPLDRMERCSLSTAWNAAAPPTAWNAAAHPDHMERCGIEHCNFFDRLDARGLSAAAVFSIHELAAPSARYVAQISEGG